MIQLNRNYIISIAVFLLLIVWLASGQFNQTSDGQLIERQVDIGKPLHVQVMTLKTETTQHEILLSGKTEPGRSVELRAETPGKIVTLFKIKGDFVNTGEKIAQIDLRDWQQQLTKAKSQVQQFNLEYEGAIKLEKKGLISQTKLAEIFANLQSAKAEVKHIEVKLSGLTITAPFAGVLDELPVELGDFVKEGDLIAAILDFSPYVIAGDIAERQTKDLKNGMQAFARLITGKEVEGKIRYIQAMANETTRTIKIEIEIPNDDQQMTAGMTAEIRIPLQSVDASFISPALLSLDEKGRLGVKIVDQEDRVQFQEVAIVYAQTDGVWISGLEKGARIISVGGGFVRPGVKVVPIEQQSSP